ncbi:hypothetical protein BG000_008616 [Podila horticola]|nr:hypothetical protein BG000_008616 [Podila horticola]
MTFISAKETPNPLDIPEVLSLVASFVSVWDKTKFKPCDLLSCSLVNKLWRQVMMPHLWAVYSPGPMVKVPINVIAQNSVHFRHFDAARTDRGRNGPIPLELWYKDPTTGQSRLRCTGLRTIVLSPFALEGQLNLLRANRSIVSLDWSWGAPTPEERAIIPSAVEPCSLSLKELRLSGDEISLEDLVILFDKFTRLERFTLATTPNSGLFTRQITELTESASARSNTLKQLTIHDKRHYPKRLGPVLSIFRNCPMVEHVVVKVLYPPRLQFVRQQLPDQHCESFLSCWDHLLAVQSTVLAWKSRQKDASPSAVHTGDSKDKAGFSLIPISKVASRGVETLDIHHVLGHPTVPCHVQFRHGYQDLVVLRTCIRKFDPHVIVDLVRTFRHSLRQLELKCEPILAGYTFMEVLGRILGLLTKLQGLELDAGCEMGMDASFAVFQGEFDLEAKGGLTTTETPSTQATGWACRHLEKLSFRGLWLTDDHDCPDKDQDVTLETTSVDHQWIAKSPAKVDKQLQAIISARIRTLPALRELTLGTVPFAYTRSRPPTTSPQPQRAN